MASFGCVLNFSDRRAEGSAAEIGEGDNPSFLPSAGHQAPRPPTQFWEPLASSPNFPRPYLTGPSPSCPFSSSSPFPSLPPFSSILSGPCPPAPIPRHSNSADPGTSPSLRFYSIVSGPSQPAPIPWDSNSGAIGSSVGVPYHNPPTGAPELVVYIDHKKGTTEAQLRRNLNARASEVSRIKKQAKRRITEMEDKYKEAREALQRKDEALQRKDEELRRKDEENKYLRQQLENNK
ncbi:hypothetical protein E4U58_000842 [Claviceps cyperi]|nr:hypothetical protein E4U58_000842 [Claviceps cyperi]